jgi:hypothetical protein
MNGRLRQRLKSQESTGGDFGALYSSRFFSYSMRSIIVIRLIGSQVTAKSLDQRSVSPKFKQPLTVGAQAVEDGNESSTPSANC